MTGEHWTILVLIDRQLVSNNTLKRLLFTDVNFCEINYHGCKFCYILRGFIFADGKILDMSPGLIFAVTRNVMFMSNMIIAGEKEIFAKLSEIY